MGRIKTQPVKRITNQIVKEHRGELKKDFNENKKIVEQFVEIRSKKLRNSIAGYATRLAKKEEE